MAIYNMSKIKEWYEDFNSCKLNFSNNYYQSYESSYVATNGNDDINSIKIKLEGYYTRLKNAYSKVETHWNNFYNDMMDTDTALAGQMSSGTCSSKVSSLISAMPNLEEYRADLQLLNSLKTNEAFAGIDIENSFNSQQDSNFFDALLATGATITISSVESVASIGERFVDFLAIGTSAVRSVETLAGDFFNLIKSKVYNDSSYITNYTEQLWENTRAFVSESYVENFFNSFYEDTDAGQWVKNNSWNFDTVRSITKDTVESVILTSLDCFSFGGTSAMYIAEKATKHIEENWQDENLSTGKAVFKSFLQTGKDYALYEFRKLNIGSSNPVANNFSDNLSRKFKDKALDAVKEIGKDFLRDGSVAVFDHASDVVLDACFSEDQITDANGDIIKFNSASDKIKYYYEQSGGFKQTANILINTLASSLIFENKSNNEKLKLKDKKLDSDKLFDFDKFKSKAVNKIKDKIKEETISTVEDGVLENISEGI